ncbi:multidrug effflux MFS transporter [Aliiroseovarius sp.]|uniref:multidrug effflux MFS transporter n=1 Tax=Aliiroseovarius sp. TaxID=1872442 RepID=UPI003BAA7CB9
MDKIAKAAYACAMADLPATRFLDPRTPPHVATLTLIVAAGAMSMNVFLPALPAMSTHFAVDYRVMQLSVALYLAMNGLLQIVVGPISDRFGRRPVILWSFTLFLLATLGCILAPNVQIFLAFRMGQAVIVGGMAISRAAIRDIHPPDQAASMLGYVTMGMSVVPMIGPAFGGILDQSFGWQSVFWMQLILGAAVFALAWRDMGETFTRREGGFAAQFREYPELLLSPRFWGYCLAAAFASGAFFAYLGGAPFVASEIYGMDSATMGIYFGAPALGYFLGNYLSGRYAVRAGVNSMIAWGGVVSTVGMVLSLAIFYAGFATAEVFFGFMTVVGVGNGLVLPSANAGMLSVRPQLAGSASGLGGAIMIGGGAALSAFTGWLLTPETGAFPLIWIMLLSSAASILAIWGVVRRERRL